MVKLWEKIKSWFSPQDEDAELPSSDAIGEPKAEDKQEVDDGKEEEVP